MKCPFITGKYILTCTAHEKADVYVPSLFELEEYCKSIRHPRCPLKYQDSGKQNSFELRKYSSLKW